MNSHELLSTTMRAVWDDTGERDSRQAADYINDRLPDLAKEPVLIDLLANAYSSFLTLLGREPVRVPEPAVNPANIAVVPDDETGTPAGVELPVVRRTPAINPRSQVGYAIAALDRRPYYVQSRGQHNGVRFAYMTSALWTEWAEYRRSIAAGYEASARWAEGIVIRMTEFEVDTSGELPADVKIALFNGEPELLAS